MIGAMIKIKGEGFVKKLKAQDIRVYTVSSAALVDLMASGELGASFHIYRNHAMPCWLKPPADSPPQYSAGITSPFKSTTWHFALIRSPARES